MSMSFLASRFQAASRSAAALAAAAGAVCCAATTSGLTTKTKRKVTRERLLRIGRLLQGISGARVLPQARLPVAATSPQDSSSAGLVLEQTGEESRRAGFLAATEESEYSFRGAAVPRGGPFFSRP